MKKLCVTLCLSVLVFHSFAQSINDSITKDDAKDILGYLASDKLKGRVNFTKEQREAAEFISGKFKEYGLHRFPGFSSFYHPFQPYPARAKYQGKLYWNDNVLPDSSFVFLPHSIRINSSKLEDFLIMKADLPLADSLLFNLWNDTLKVLIWIPADTNVTNVTENLVLPISLPRSDILIAASSKEPLSMDFHESKNSGEHILYNIVGILPGKTIPEEAILFSAHYDHVDKDIFGQRKGIFNGANDDASGTTAVMMLAKYFAMKKDNERTLIFCLFAGEELGLLGSKAFVNDINLAAVKAVINIEMIGSHSAAGKNGFFLTGSSYSDLISILKKNTVQPGFNIQENNDDKRQLFRRSDNYSFAERGVIAHTIMCSDDRDPCYHKPCDEVKWVDIDNMTKVIRVIAKSCATLISGTDTPVKKN